MKFCNVGIISFLLIVVLNSSALSQNALDINKDVEKYIDSIDKFVAENSDAKLIFGDLSDGTKRESEPDWKKFKNKTSLENARDGKNLNEIAYIWLKNGNLVYVSYLFTSPSGDWFHYVHYYFRNDGSIIKVKSDLRTFHGDVIVETRSYFNLGGSLIKSLRRVLDLQSKKLIDINSDRRFIDRGTKTFKSISKLPFYDLVVRNTN